MSNSLQIINCWFFLVVLLCKNSLIKKSSWFARWRYSFCSERAKGKQGVTFKLLGPSFSALAQKLWTQRTPQFWRVNSVTNNLKATPCFPFARSLQKENLPLANQEDFLIKEILQGGPLGKITINNKLGYRRTTFILKYKLEKLLLIRIGHQFFYKLHTLIRTRKGLIPFPIYNERGTLS